MIKPDDFVFRPLETADLALIIRWQYEPPYDIYNFPTDAVVDDEVGYFEDERNGRFYAITTPTNDLVGYCTFFADARVPGGDYRAEALDIGLGVRPDLTGLGKGVGLGFITAVLAFATQEFNQPAKFRVTIANFNKRAQRVWQRAGFTQGESFGRASDGFPFTIFTK